MKRILPVIISLFLLTACGSESVAQIGKIKLTDGEFRFYLESIKTQMQGTELETDADWEIQEIEGKKAIDVAKERAMDIAVKNALYIEASKASGIILDSNEKMTIDKMKAQLISGYGGKKGYDKYLKENDVTDKFMNMMLESSAYQSKINNIVMTEDPVTEEESLAYYEENRGDLETRYRKAKNLLVLTSEATTGIPLGTADMEKAKNRAKELLDRAYAGEDFDALVAQYTQDPGMLESPDGYVFTTGEMVPEFEDAVDSVGYGEIAYCESEYGCHIIMRVPVTYEDVKEFIEKDIYKEKVDKKIYGWAEEFGVEITKYEENYKDIK